MTPTPWSTMIRQEHVSWSPSSSSSSCFQSVFSTAALNYILLEEVVEEVIMMKTEKPRDIIITDKTDKDKETGHHHPSIMKVSKKIVFVNFALFWKSVSAVVSQIIEADFWVQYQLWQNFNQDSILKLSVYHFRFPICSTSGFCLNKLSWLSSGLMRGYKLDQQWSAIVPDPIMIFINNFMDHWMHPQCWEPAE